MSIVRLSFCVTQTKLSMALYNTDGALNTLSCSMDQSNINLLPGLITADLSGADIVVQGE